MSSKSLSEIASILILPDTSKTDVEGGDALSLVVSMSLKCPMLAVYMSIFYSSILKLGT